MPKQKAFILVTWLYSGKDHLTDSKKSNLADLNKLLEQGWRVATATPMTDANNYVASLVILEQGE